MTGNTVSALLRIGSVYSRYHFPEYISPDPLEIVLEKRGSDSAELTAFIAASFALGRVESILSFLRRLLERIHPVREILMLGDYSEIEARVGDLKYRFFSGTQIAAFLYGLGMTVRKYGSIEDTFRYFDAQEESLYPALEGFVNQVRAETSEDCGILLPCPKRNSACKRYHLFLRWMVRKDRIDPGLWRSFHPSRLLYPVDTHLLRICQELGITRRKQADRKTAIEITKYFRTLDPDDPVKYDFSLTRLGIHPDLSYDTIENEQNLSV